jgi:hypothetical protein
MLYWRIDAKVVGLAKHRTDAGHLEYPPLRHFVLAARVGRQEASGLAGQEQQDRARFEQRDRLAVGPVGVDESRDLVVGADGQQPRLELLAGADVHGVHAVGQVALLEHDVQLVPVWRGPRIHFDDRAILLAHRRAQLQQRCSSS